MDENIKHIDDETLAAFIDNRLLGTAYDDVAKHLLECDECRKTTMDVSKMKKSHTLGAANNKKVFMRYLAPLAIAASVVLVVVPVTKEQQFEDVPYMSKGSIVIKKAKEEESWLEKAQMWIDETINEIFGDYDE